ITAGLVAHKMGLPIHHFIAANNANRVVFDYINSGDYTPRPSIETIANAMDVGAPSNFTRILDLYNHTHAEIIQVIKSVTYSDQQIRETIQKVYNQYDYLCDPHGACAFRSLEETLKNEEIGVFLETAHPAKFTETVEEVVGKGNVEMPNKLLDFMKGEKKSIQLNSEYSSFKNYLLINSK
ncbi:MAG: threonine synthase, partial [Bacteroidales bacterium]|nr:threonine synthase [Bacteroidales bacterium]